MALNKKGQAPQTSVGEKLRKKQQKQKT